MVHIHKKKLKGHTYYYLRKIERVDGKPKVVWQKYLGSAEKIKERFEQGREQISLTSFQYGKTAALMGVSKDIDFINVVDKHAKLERCHGLTAGEYMQLFIFGRCDKPVSKNSMGKWFANSCMSLFYDFSHKLNCQNYINHMNRVHKVRKKIQTYLAKTLIQKGLKPSVIIWDRSNFYTHITKGQKLLKKGKCKHHRYDKNLVDLGLLVSQENVPFMHTVHEANMHDAKSFPKMLRELTEQLKKLKVNAKELVIVFDKGNNSEPNIKKVTEDIHVVGSIQHSQAKELLDVPLKRYKFLYENKKRHKIFGYRVKKNLYGSDMIVVISYNESSYKKQNASYMRSKKRVMDNLKDLKRRLENPKKRGRKRKRSGIDQEINDIIDKDMRSVIQYSVKEVKDQFKLKYEIKKEVEEYRMSTFGKNIIFTDMHAWKAKRIVMTYNSKYKVEDDFKWLNNTALLPIKPFFSRLDKPIESHVFLCVMGLLFYRYLFWKVEKLGVKLPCERIVEELNGIRIAVVNDKSTGITLKVEKMTPVQARLFSVLDLGQFFDNRGIFS